MILTLYAVVLVLLAGLPVAMMFRNLALFNKATNATNLLAMADEEKVSVLVPARNEEISIRAALESILKYGNESLEVIVLDDCSEDRTARIVQQVMLVDTRVRLIDAIPLPEGWNGKQHACWRLAKAATHPWLLFLDADVRFTRDAIPRMIAQAKVNNVDLLSGFPTQETGTIAEKLLIPLMHFVLLGYLPIKQMRTSTDPSLSAGCGQLMLAKSEAYWRCDGHRAIQASRHDGIQLPRAFRNHELRTDIFDASDLARCRMYQNCSQVVRGLLKNATEGIASNKLIFVFTILLAGAAVLPVLSFLLVIAGVVPATNLQLSLLALATVLSWAPRVMATMRFAQSWTGTLLHPLSVLCFLILQWVAWSQNFLGIRIAWRGRR